MFQWYIYKAGLYRVWSILSDPVKVAMFDKNDYAPKATLTNMYTNTCLSFLPGNLQQYTGVKTTAISTKGKLF